MENDKPTYETIEQELNEYKELLWQLSDEYRENVGKAEKKITDLEEKCKQLEEGTTSLEAVVSEKEEEPFIKQLGLPACILSSNGELAEYNNKFKFLVELLSYEIEDVQNISYLLKKDTGKELMQKYIDFQSSELSVFQSLYKVNSAFRGVVNILIRIYRLGDTNQYLALFVELNKEELNDLAERQPRMVPTPPEIKTKVAKKEDEEEQAGDDSINTEIAVFAEKYEVYKTVSKLFGSKKSKKAEMDPNILHEGIKDAFSLGGARIKLLDKINTEHKNFIQEFTKVYTDLTSNEKKHCMLIKAGLTYKEIAALMGISINGVKIARNRLRKKLSLDNEVKTNDFIDGF